MKTETKYKDRLFNFIFGREEHKDWTLSLYNAVNGSHYTDPDLVEFNTLENTLYISMKNDTSFLISDIMSVYEHQSSYNPNMPLRMMEYTSNLYTGYLARNKYNKYSRTLIPLPVPKLVVFYNGEKEVEDETILELSDAFPSELKFESDIEVRVKMLNINYDRNRELLRACQPLGEYSWFVREVRSNLKIHTLEDAVDMAIQKMPDTYMLKPFLVAQKMEVCGMLDTEYNEDEIRELFMEDGRREERQKTEAAEKRADEEKMRADAAEAELAKYKDKFGALN